MQAFAATAATAVMTAQNVSAQGLQRSVEASERERVRWARELHDETLQELAALRISLSSARKSGDAHALERAAEEAVERATAAIAALRNLITDMRPASLDELGAGPALEALIERTQRLSGLPIDADIDLAYEAGRATERHASETEVAIYRLVQEGLTNAAKHAEGAAVHVSISRRRDGGDDPRARRRARLRARRPPRGLRAHRRTRTRHPDRRHPAASTPRPGPARRSKPHCLRGGARARRRASTSPADERACALPEAFPARRGGTGTSRERGHGCSTARAPH